MSYTSSEKMLHFCDNLLSVIIRAGPMSQQPSGRVPTSIYNHQPISPVA